MIVYFADRKFNILGHASTSLPSGYTISEDKKVEDIESGVSSFEFKVSFDAKTRNAVENCAEVGNYVLRKNDDENEFYTIIDTEIDTKDQTVYVYAEDAGLDLLNEVVGSYEADKAYSIAYYVDKFAKDSGFKIGRNEIKSATRKLSWDGDSTVTERLASVATQFDAEISYSFDVDGLIITNKIINIYRERGKERGVQLRLNRELDRIVTKKSIANLATALSCTGGTPDGKDEPITLKGYSYDDGDFYVSGKQLRSRSALKKWSRYIWDGEPNQLSGYSGHIVKKYEYDTDSQKTLCAHAITELKELSEIEVNYEVDISRLPDNVKIGDRVDIVDDAGELYLSTRILKLETSVCDQTQEATLGEHLLKTSGISTKVQALAEKFATLYSGTKKAELAAANAQSAADEAKTQAYQAIKDAALAQTAANNAATVADHAKKSAETAQAAADAATSAVTTVQEDVASLQATVDTAQAAADYAKQAAETADAKATEAATNAQQAITDAANAASAAGTAQETANTAVSKADTAQTTADNAQSDATAAKTTADAAKLDAETAQADIDALGTHLTTLSNTMSADYARKTDLTEATANLQTQISQNAAEISSTASKVATIDETANNAAAQAADAQSTAASAKSAADAASADATAAQTAADNAAAAASAAQAKADTAADAAATAQSVADKADADLAAAKADLATVQSRVDATEADIEAAQTAVNTAQAAADKAKADAASASNAASVAQRTADTAVSNASAAQTAADNAAQKALLAQKAADDAAADAASAQAKADQAAETAATAKSTAETAVSNAEAAQTKANAAAADAAAAQKAADDADAKAAQAAADLATAQQNLADVTSRVDATEAEVEAAQAAVNAAQASATAAAADAAAAQSTADKAKADAATAQAAADNAKSAADAAQSAADAAQAAADDAQSAVNALAVRVTSAETKITQNSDKIALAATKDEVTQTLGGYYTKSETDAAITVKANEITQSVESNYTTKEQFFGLEIGGRNLLLGSDFSGFEGDDSSIIISPSERMVTFTSDVLQNKLSLEMLLSDYAVVNCKGKKIVLGGEYKINSTLTYGTTNKWAGYQVSVTRDDTTGGSTQYLNWIGSNMLGTEPTSDWVKFVGEYTISDYNATKISCSVLFRDVIGSVSFRNLKIEFGTKSTDWTPAPEDMYADISAVNDTVHTQRTEIVEDCESIILSALETYVETDDYDQFKETVSAQLQILSDEIGMKFTETSENIDSVNSDLQTNLERIYKYISFSDDGIIIKSGENSVELQLDNEKGIIFSKNGVEFGSWDGTDFHTGNIVVDVDERAQFGNFAFTPLADGSLSFGKVG